MMRLKIIIIALANDIGRFFVRKIDRIRLDIEAVDLDQS